MCPNGFETIEGSVVIPKGEISPSSVKKVLVNRLYIYIDRKKPLITIFRILNHVGPHVRRSSTVAVLNGVKPRKSVTFINHHCSF